MDGETLDDWFNSVEAGVPVDHGFYDPGTRESDGGSGYLYNLDYNPDDPDPDPADGDPKHDLDRETLRRYINLGGWYKVAICEDPDKLDPDTPDGWTEQIPVYVPPRRNEYVENKVYNFIGENAALFNWPGTVGDTLYLPGAVITLSGRWTRPLPTRRAWVCLSMTRAERSLMAEATAPMCLRKEIPCGPSCPAMRNPTGLRPSTTVRLAHSPARSSP